MCWVVGYLGNRQATEVLVEKLDDRVIYILKVDDMFTSIIIVIPMILLAYHASNIRDLDVDKPRNLAKSVTVE